MQFPSSKPFLISLLALASCLSAQSATYKEVGGVVVVEGEHFDARQTATDDDHHWAIVPDELSADDAAAPVGQYQNARGGKYMVSLPDSPGGGQNRNSADLQNAGPALDYKVQITTTGEYALYLRATGYDGSSDSMYARIVELQPDQGGPGPDWYRYAPTPADGDFNTERHGGAGGWDDMLTPEVNDAGGAEVAATWTISKAGTYTIRIQQREDGSGVDALILQLSSLPPPVDPSLPESQAAGGVPQPLFISSESPSPNAKTAAPNIAIKVGFQEGTTTLDQSSVVLKLDGAAVTPQITAGAAGAVTVTFQPPTLFAAKSTHNVSIDFKDNTGKAGNDAWSFTVQDYITIAASAAVQADTSKKGFLVRTWQVDATTANGVAKAEAELAGQLGDNIADTSSFTDKQYGNSYLDETGVINYWDTGGVGNFPNDTANVPGISSPGDNYSVEMITFLDLPAGYLTMGVNSDDGFRTQFSPSGDPRDKLAVTLGQFDAGRGVANTLFSMAVENAGVYAFRTVWEEGGGDSACEWFTVTPDNKKHLINDSTDSASIKAYRAAQGNPYVQAFTPDFFGFKLELVDNGSVAVDDKSVAVTVDGSAASTTAAKAGNVTTVTYAPSEAWVGGSSHTLGLSFKDTSGKSYSRSSTFTAPLGFVAGSYAAGPADTSKKGFLVRTWHSTGQPNTIAWTEDQLDGKHGANNLAQPDIFTDTQFGNKYYDETGVIDYWNTGGEGNFPNNATQNVPGLANDGTNDDNYSLEVLTFLDLPAGKVTMGVNSDDGFRVYVLPSGNPQDKGIPLGQFDGGRGVADTTFDLTVEKAGIYPFRMVYEEGGGDSAVEWFSVTTDGNKHLINDGNDSAAIKAYRAAQIISSEKPKFTSFKVAGGNITIEWTGGGTLQSADDITGPWTDVTGATSPFTTPTAGAHKFARIKK